MVWKILKDLNPRYSCTYSIIICKVPSVCQKLCWKKLKHSSHNLVKQEYISKWKNFYCIFSFVTIFIHILFKRDLNNDYNNSLMNSVLKNAHNVMGAWRRSSPLHKHIWKLTLPPGLQVKIVFVWMYKTTQLKWWILYLPHFLLHTCVLRFWKAILSSLRQ